ncbi:hypothetical protein FHU29_004617 [Hoyosella altamirensis]|uniref:Phage head morphogenesis domain-containing protein n=3 Tax=Hoyosella altamirensis TaxID=616997 RepID=A0A839RT87_9ACTN|nr:phage minor head protein [Hoyosella altamirensis]MBB3040122.1 hypothetical protein [Hoyosella altamirensis]
MSDHRRRGLLNVLTFERRVHELAMDLYAAWLPDVRRAVLPELAAAALTPEPSNIAVTQARFEELLDTIFIAGMHDLTAGHIAATITAAGITADMLPWPDNATPQTGTVTARMVTRIPAITQWQTVYLSQVRNRMVNTPDTVYKAISTHVAEALRLGESIPQMRDRIATELDVTNVEQWPRRATVVARTESGGAMNSATRQAAILQSDITGTLLDQVWIATPGSDRTRETHLEAHGQRVPLGEHFIVGGYELAAPGDPDGPAEEVIQCRCTLLTVERGENVPGLDTWALAASLDPTITHQTAAAADGGHAMEEFRSWEGLLIPFNTVSRDRLSLASPDLKLVNEKLPLVLNWQEKDDPDHDGAFTVGAIEAFETRDDGIWGRGYFLNTEHADDAVDQARRDLTAPSVFAIVTNEVLATPDGQPITDEQLEQAINADEPIDAVPMWLEAEIAAVTLVAIPAWRETSITIGDTVERDDTMPAVLQAAGHRLATLDEHRPRAVMFADPKLTEPTPLHMTSDGRIIGHVAQEGCHRGFTDRCVPVPRSNTGYAHFHTSSVRTAEGDTLPVGRLTVGGGHAAAGADARAAVEHYDDVGTCFALGRLFDDGIGIAFSGVPHPQATVDQVEEGLSAPMSGDWRTLGGNLELVAVCAVNTPGFPVIQRSRTASGERLIASLSPTTNKHDTPITVNLNQLAANLLDEYRTGELRRAQADAIRDSIAVKRRSEHERLTASIHQK